MQTSQVRDLFLDYFATKDHLILPSYSLVPRNDPTLLLIGAGMAPLKPFFTGEKKPPHPRVATCQKCVRTPDIERVGHTGRHATFFEMLGNFSFGDYFKEGAIEWAWDLVLNGYRLPEERLWVSIYLEDEEAFKIWNEQIGIPAAKIKRMGKEDNFWEIGLGPCGPCSEIYYDLGEAVGCGRPDCAVGCDCDRYLEIWNLVFTQFSREPNGELIELTQKNIDTGAGLERMATALQGVGSFYETDLIKPLFSHLTALVPAERRSQEVPLRIVTEHSRGTTFLIADGVIPSNEGRGYVLRRLLRRAVRYGRLLGIEGEFLAEMAALVVDIYGAAYPELKDRQAYINQVVKLEEQRFGETLAQGIEILEGYISKLQAENQKELPGDLAFKLYDTYGFPLDLTAEILEEEGLSVDDGAFRKNLQDQQERARAAARTSGEAGSEDRYRAAEGFDTVFTGYEALSNEARLLLALVDGKEADGLKEGQNAEIVLDRTPFYAEAGGQLGDTGSIYSRAGRFKVENTIYSPAGVIIHQGVVEEGSFKSGDAVTALVNEGRRQGICRSHTATHLLHRALRNKLGDHVNQAGSLVAADRLRFDFNHFAALKPEEIAAVEKEVNSIIMANLKVRVQLCSLEEAQDAGAVAIFTEKYDEGKVRMITTGDYTSELCGGTHVSATGEIGLFRLTTEEGIGSGLRRIEAVTGMGSYRRVLEKENLLARLASALNVSDGFLEHRFNELLTEYKDLQRANRELTRRLAGFEVAELLDNIITVEGVKVVSAIASADSMETLRLVNDEIKGKLSSAVVMLGAVKDGKVFLVGSVSHDLVGRGIRADRLIKAVAGLVDGGGGGKPELAQAGGKNPAALPEALERVQNLVREQLKAGR